MAGLLHFPFGFRAEAVLMFFPCDCFKKNEAAKLINIFSITPVCLLFLLFLVFLPSKRGKSRVHRKKLIALRNQTLPIHCVFRFSIRIVFSPNREFSISVRFF